MAGSDTDHVDSIDVKVTLTGVDLPRARTAFALDDPTGRRSLLWFCERPTQGRALTLLDAGIVLRLRETGDGGEATVVLRPAWPERLTPGWIRPRAGGPRISVVGEWTPHARLVAASATCPVPGLALRAALATRERLAGAFSPEQQALLREAAPSSLTWDTLRPFGPVEVLSWARQMDLGRLRATLWTVGPAPTELLQLCVTAEPAEAPLVLPALVAAVRQRGLDPEAFATTRTRVVLALLAGS